ncbi:ABC transporter ATP-binding protein [Jatrophihabitans sp. YIM 134969]
MASPSPGEGPGRGSGRGVAVRARGWGFRHAGRLAPALTDLDLDVAAGERVLLLGASGSGKSTLVRGMAGLLAASEGGEASGSLTLDGVDATSARARAGLVLQDPESGIVMGRVGDDVAFGPENHAVPPGRIWARVDAALGAVGFPYGRERPTAALSGGEKQRLALAGVVALRPGLLLLDEPTANLDPPAAAQVVAAVSDVATAQGLTLVVIEHRVEAWADLVDRVVVLAAGGGILADGPPATVFRTAVEVLRAAGVWVPGAVVSPRRASGPAGEPIVDLTDVGSTYRGAAAPALHPTSLTLRAGEAVAVSGPSGSGKSTLARLAAGLARPTTGTAVRAADSRPLAKLRARELAATVGTVFQQPEHQFVTGSVRDELLVAPRRLGWSEARAGSRADELLEVLRLARLGPANPFTLSGGEQRRLSVATALSVAPPLLVLDEPTFGQDAATWAALLELLAGVRDDGTGLLVVSHDVALVQALADRALTMTAGRVSTAVSA